VCRSLTNTPDKSPAHAAPGVTSAPVAGPATPRRSARLPPLARYWLLLGCLALALPTLATAASNPAGARIADTASPNEVAERQGDLKSLRLQIDTLRREMAAAEGSRRDAVDQLKDAERAISTTQRDLLQLTTQVDSLQATLRDLGTQARALEQQLSAQQAQLGKLLYRQYLRGTPDPLRLFLNGDDPNQLARDLHYLGLIGRARSQILQEIEATLHRKQALATDTRQQAEQLSASEAREKEAHAKLLAQREQRQAMLDKVSDHIATQRREIGNLQRDERRMAELVERLSKIIATRAREAQEAHREAQRREAARQVAQQAAAQQAAQQAARQVARQATTQDKPARAARSLAEKPLVEKVPVATPPVPEAHVETTPPAPGNLARMKGQLRLPTRGSISNRFGTPRQEGSTWKGLFILASAGSEVRSIAGGRVVFAEWMRGFGNLLIIDHGGSYLSIYANNDSLLKQVGDEVRAAETIATVGNSGGNPESGLYFELRHQGKPLDPLAWVNPK
jgi:septal ring factor EnvC (AmiA/AmiB activator)